MVERKKNGSTDNGKWSKIQIIRESASCEAVEMKAIGVDQLWEM